MKDRVAREQIGDVRRMLDKLDTDIHIREYHPLGFFEKSLKKYILDMEQSIKGVMGRIELLEKFLNAEYVGASTLPEHYRKKEKK